MLMEIAFDEERIRKEGVCTSEDLWEYVNFVMEELDLIEIQKGVYKAKVEREAFACFGAAYLTFSENGSFERYVTTWKWYDYEDLNGPYEDIIEGRKHIKVYV